MHTACTLPYGGIPGRPPGQRTPLLHVTESETRVKTLPCRNFVAGGKNNVVRILIWILDDTTEPALWGHFKLRRK